MLRRPSLIAAALQVDVRFLFSVQFKQISIVLTAVESSQDTSIIIVKEKGNIKLRYTIQEEASQDAKEYTIERSFGERTYGLFSLPFHTSHDQIEGEPLSKAISDLVEVNWMSIHRKAVEPEPKIVEDTYESSVDQKLNDLSRRFSEYFSLLRSRADTENIEFQKKFFLTMLKKPIQSKPESLQNNNSGINRYTVLEIFRDLGIEESRAKKSVDDFFNRLEVM